jgi:hypothetical protein
MCLNPQSCHWSLDIPLLLSCIQPHSVVLAARCTVTTSFVATFSPSNVRARNTQSHTISLPVAFSADANSSRELNLVICGETGSFSRSDRTRARSIEYRNSRERQPVSSFFHRREYATWRRSRTSGAVASQQGKRGQYVGQWEWGQENCHSTLSKATAVAVQLL